MERFMLKSKIHRARVTDANVDYEGSLTLDGELMEAADLMPFERIDVYNITTGSRFSTYVIEGERGSGTVCVNGAAAHLAKEGDLIIIASYALVEARKGYRPRLIYVDGENRIMERPSVEALPSGTMG